MLICPGCRGENLEEALTCTVCGKELEASSLSRKARRTQATDSLLNYQPTQPKQVNTALRIATVVLVCVGLLAFFVLKDSGESSSPVTRSLSGAAERIALQQTQGTLTAETIAQAEQTAAAASGCGHVHSWVVPAPDTSSGTPGQQQSAESLVKEYVSVTFKPDAVASATADQEQTIVVVAGWACA